MNTKYKNFLTRRSFVAKKKKKVSETDVNASRGLKIRKEDVLL